MQELNELHLINLASVLLTAIVAVLPHNPARIALGLPFVLFFPGYTLIAALYPRREDLSGVERLALSFGLSLAVVPLIGLMLNFLPWGIRLEPILVSLAVFIAICSMLAARARRRLPPTERFSIEITPLLAQGRVFSWSRIVTAAVIMASVVFVGWRLHAASPLTGETFTEFYVLGPSGKAEGYPDRVVAGEAAEVTLGIINHELRQGTYRITIQANGRILVTLGPIVLADGQKWERRMRFSPVETGDRKKIDLLLFKGNSPAPYRRLHLWMKVLPH